MEDFEHLLKAQNKCPKFNEGAKWAFNQIQGNTKLIDDYLIPEHHCQDFEYKLGVLRCSKQCDECRLIEGLGDTF